MSKNKLLLTISVLNEEVLERKSFIIKTIKNLHDSKIDNYQILIVIQVDKKNKTSDLDTLFNFKNIKIVFSHIKSVSHARNIGIEYAIKNFFSHIIISDSMVIVSSDFFINVDKCMDINTDLMRGSVVWTNDFSSVHHTEKLSLQKEIDIFKDSYIGSFLFKVQKLRDLRFNENIGPASYTTIKAGEDVLFLHFYTKKYGYKFTSVSGCIYHPPRDKDLSKHLKYAKGQGALYRYFLSQDIKPKKYYLYLLLFLLNSLVRVVLFKKNSINILRDRIYGFFILKLK